MNQKISTFSQRSRLEDERYLSLFNELLRIHKFEGFQILLNKKIPASIKKRGLYPKNIISLKNRPTNRG